MYLEDILNQILAKVTNIENTLKKPAAEKSPQGAAKVSRAAKLAALTKEIGPVPVLVPDAAAGQPAVARAPVVETRETPTLPISSTLENEVEQEENAVDFLTQATVVATATIDDVRKALSDLVTRKGGMKAGGADAAYKVLKTAGQAERLPGSPKDQELGANAPGALKPEFYQAVVDAAQKA